MNTGFAAAKIKNCEPENSAGDQEQMSIFGKIKRLVVGKALRNEQAAHERLSKKVALAVFSSDALSSTAYATEEILLVPAYLFGIRPHENETVISQFARHIFTDGMGWFYFVVQAATAAILILAANTAFADFPRLSSLLTRDRFLPRQFANRGDKLVFSNGIMILALFAALLVVDFEEDATARLKERREKLDPGVKLVILPSPYRELTRPLLRFIYRLDRRRDDEMITIVLPEFVPAKWWQHLLHNQSSLLLKGKLLFKPGIIVTNVPYHLKQ